MAKIKSVKIKIEDTGGKFVASLFINGKVIHTTYPQLSRNNAIMLINRKISQFNAMNGSYLKPYRE